MTKTSQVHYNVIVSSAAHHLKGLKAPLLRTVLMRRVPVTFDENHSPLRWQNWSQMEELRWQLKIALKLISTQPGKNWRKLTHSMGFLNPILFPAPQNSRWKKGLKIEWRINFQSLLTMTGMPVTLTSLQDVLWIDNWHNQIWGDSSVENRKWSWPLLTTKRARSVKKGKQVLEIESRSSLLRAGN